MSGSTSAAVVVGALQILDLELELESYVYGIFNYVQNNIYNPVLYSKACQLVFLL